MTTNDEQHSFRSRLALLSRHPVVTLTSGVRSFHILNNKWSKRAEGHKNVILDQVLREADTAAPPSHIVLYPLYPLAHTGLPTTFKVCPCLQDRLAALRVFAFPERSPSFPPTNVKRPLYNKVLHWFRTTTKTRTVRVLNSNCRYSSDLFQTTSLKLGGIGSDEAVFKFATNLVN